jgi:FMNH2-dependent dimethyl sulfone monooxygenase
MTHFSSNKLQLGVFGANVSNGCAATLAPGHFELNWPNSRRVVQLADQAGFEIIVPVARWKGFGGATNFNGTNFETLTWASGLGSITEHTTIFSTSHVPTLHPIVAAKQCTTADHISSGRFGLNIVCGWFEEEFRMFGSPVMEHETRYAYAAEWIEIVKKLWTLEEEFDFEGRFFKIEKGFHQPKPLRKPHPPIMNAGASPTGARFAAQYADIAFQGIHKETRDENQQEIAALRRLGREEFNREFQVWSSCSVVCRPTEKEAQEYAHYYVYEKGDWVATENLIRELGIQHSYMPPAALEKLKAKFLAGWGGTPLVGTPEQIVDKLVEISKMDINGVVLSWVNYQDELQDWIQTVLPLMEQAGLRHPYKPITAPVAR